MLLAPATGLLTSILDASTEGILDTILFRGFQTVLLSFGETTGPWESGGGEYCGRTQCVGGGTWRKPEQHRSPSALHTGF